MFCLPPTSRPSTRLTSAVSLSTYLYDSTRTRLRFPSLSLFLAKDLDQSCRDLPFEFFGREISFAARRVVFGADG